MMTTERHASDPAHDCALCPRLNAFTSKWRATQSQWHNGPVRTWVPDKGDASVRLLIIGLAPGLRGANRTGRPFTGDASGETLFAALAKFGLASGDPTEDFGYAMRLHGVAITNAVRCVPPQNKPVAAEINACANTFLAQTISRFSNLEAMITLGKIAHEATVRTLGAKASDHPFGHNRTTSIGPLNITASYHCSRYNMNTRRLTIEMFEDVFAAYSAPER